MRRTLGPLSVSIAVSLGCVGEGTFFELSQQVSTAMQLSLGSAHPSFGPLAPVDPQNWGNGTWGPGSHFVAGEGSDLQIGIFSASATAILLEVYSEATGADAAADYWMVKGADDIWRAQLAQVPGKTLYAFRAWGPNWPFDGAWTRGSSSAGFLSDVDALGHRFNPNKVLYDPYARELSHDKTSSPLLAAGHEGKVFGSGPGVYQGRARREIDTGRWAPKAVAFEDPKTWGPKPDVSQRDSVIYETHVRGLTQHSSSSRLTTLLAGLDGFAGVVDVPQDCRGTYLAAGLMAPYFKGLGINVVELLPVHETDNETIDASEWDQANYWGYMTYGFFAPDRRYACDASLGGPTREFKAMVEAFHRQGIEVWLDVVYNHTGEGGPWDTSNQTLEVTSFRGLDNPSYYALEEANRAQYWESAGVGNNFNLTTQVTRRLVLDSLSYWAHSMGVDGFRFDLATVLGRDQAFSYGFNSQAQLLLDIAEMSRRHGVDVVAEPWDLRSYNVGQFPAGWAEWNGRFRDASRRFLRGDTSGGVGISYADAFNGDFENFNDQGGPSKSINFLVAHDGFTLADLVSYQSKTNGSARWPFGPSVGGTDLNDSWDSDQNPALRRQRFRSMMAWQVFSRGVPMLVYGDEFNRSQNGNNNPYNVDSVSTWNDYDMIRTDAPQRLPTGVEGEARHDNFGVDAKADGLNSAFLFTKEVLNMRKSSPALRQGDYRMPITFAKANGDGGLNAYFDRAVRIHLDGSRVGDRDWLLFVNMYTAPIDFVAPTPDKDTQWVRVIDTAAWAEAEGNTWSAEDGKVLWGAYRVHPWSIAVFRSVSTAPAATVSVAFGCQACTTTWGQGVYVVGNIPELGSWNPLGAIPLKPTAYPTWTAAIELPSGRHIEYKFIKKDPFNVEWEAGENRLYLVPALGAGATGGAWR